MPRQLDPQEVHVAFSTARRMIDATGYGNWVSDNSLTQLVIAVVNAVEDYNAGKNAKPPENPPTPAKGDD